MDWGSCATDSKVKMAAKCQMKAEHILNMNNQEEIKNIHNESPYFLFLDFLFLLTSLVKLSFWTWYVTSAKVCETLFDNSVEKNRLSYSWTKMASRNNEL